MAVLPPPQDSLPCRSFLACFDYTLNLLSAESTPVNFSPEETILLHNWIELAENFEHLPKGKRRLLLYDSDNPTIIILVRDHCDRTRDGVTEFPIDKYRMEDFQAAWKMLFDNTAQLDRVHLIDDLLLRTLAEILLLKYQTSTKKYRSKLKKWRQIDKWLHNIDSIDGEEMVRCVLRQSAHLSRKAADEEDEDD